MNSGTKNYMLLLIGTVLLLVIALLFLMLTNKGSVEIITQPPGATIFVDGKERGSSPLTMGGLKPGKHTLLAKKDLYTETSTEVNIKRWKKEKVSISLKLSALEKLPYRDSHYYIKYEQGADGTITYKVTTFAILNRPSQYPDFLKKTAEYKKEAQEWLKSIGINPDKEKVEYSPPEAQDL